MAVEPSAYKQVGMTAQHATGRFKEPHEKVRHGLPIVREQLRIKNKRRKLSPMVTITQNMARKVVIPKGRREFWREE